MDPEKLKQKLVEIREATQNIINAAEGESRDLSADELTKIDELSDDFEACEKQLRALELASRQEATLSGSAGRRSAPANPGENSVEFEGEIRGGDFRNDDRTRWGWRSFGEQARAIVRACHPANKQVDRRLETRAPTAYGNESVGEEGGFAVAPAFATQILTRVEGEDSLLSRTTTIETGSNSWEQPTDEVAPWDNSTGVRCFWEGEADQFTQSKPKLKKQSVDLDFLTALVPVTNQNLEDAPGLGSYLSMAAPRKMSFKISLAIVQGSGAGQPLGIINGGAKVSVAKVTSQVADTIVGQNIIDMWSRLYAPSRSNAVWLINQDVEPQLDTLMIQGKLNTGAADTGWGGIVYMPANGLAPGGFATLKGRPVIPTQACETLGDEGDIILTDLSDYLTLKKAGGIRADTSIHLFFDYNMTAFRFVFRLGGRPWSSQAISPRVGSNTLSTTVTLAPRA